MLNKRQGANQLVQMSVCCAHESKMTWMYELLVLTLSIFSNRGKKIFEPPRYMSVNQAAEQLLAIVQNRRLEGQEPGISVCPSSKFKNSYANMELDHPELGKIQLAWKPEFYAGSSSCSVHHWSGRTYLKAAECWRKHNPATSSMTQFF